MKCIKNIENNMYKVDNFGMLVLNIFALGIVFSIAMFLLIQFAKWDFSYTSLRMLLIAAVISFTICKVNNTYIGE
jgi:hypothetical protein